MESFSFCKQAGPASSSSGALRGPSSGRLRRPSTTAVLMFLGVAGSAVISCHHPTEPRPWGGTPFVIADAGPDRVSFVGSYTILAGSYYSGGLDSLRYAWTEAPDNPQFQFVHETDQRQMVGFVKEGVFHYYLRVGNSQFTSLPDTLTITVGPRRQRLFEDPGLEITLRDWLQKPDGDLTPGDLLQVDSIMIQPFLYPVTSLAGLEACTNLRVAYLSLQQITDLSPLRNLTRLETLRIDQNPDLRDLSPLAGLTNLRTLVALGLQVTDLSPLAGLTQLRILTLDRDPIADLSPLAKLTEMEQLTIAIAPVRDISALKNMTHLNQFLAMYCQIDDLSPLAGLTNLQYLNLWSNKIPDVSPLAGCTKLERLYLDDNQVSEISCLRQMTSLAIVGLTRNRIQNIQALVDNSGLGKGDCVSLTGNPLDSVSVREYVPALKARGVLVILQ